MDAVFVSVLRYYSIRNEYENCRVISFLDKVSKAYGRKVTENQEDLEWGNVRFF